MTAAVLSIGTELTRGEIVNSNGAWLSSALSDLGFDVLENVTVADHRERIASAFQRLTQSARVIVCTGGLGPTSDDVTASAIASALGVNLICDQTSLDEIRRRLALAGRELSPSNAKQADLPAGAEVLANPVGTAPGFAVEANGARAFFLPGVPKEMERLYRDRVVPRIRELSPTDAFQIRLKVFGLPESQVGDRLASVETANPGVDIGYRVHFPEVEVKVLARAETHLIARDRAERAALEVRARLAPWVFGEGDDTFPAHVGRLLRGRGFTLAVAESCTGGLLGHLLTRDAGASDFFVADAVTYANSAKSKFLGLAEDVLRWHGAVSSEVAAAMAEGVKRTAQADLGVGITGIAGPGGATETKPIGLVYISVSGPTGTMVREHNFTGERGDIQMRAAYTALQMVRTVCLEAGSSRDLK
jgi:nicotinamide-nucleotide amidase